VSSTRPTLDAQSLATREASDTSPDTPVHPLVQSGAETRARLLAAAERLFKERGYDGIALRAVTQAAGTSVSAANYHFGSKEGLLRSMLEQRILPLNRARLELLDEQNDPSLESVIEAFLRPLLSTHAERLERGEDANDGRRIAAHLYGARPEILERIRGELFAEVTERFVDALVEVLPGAGRGDAALALELTDGLILHLLAVRARRSPDDPESNFFDRANDLESLLTRMVAFSVAGIRAALPGAAEGAIASEGAGR